MAHHDAEIRWERGALERFTDRRYSRAHEWRFDGGAVVAASASPHNVPLPYSVAANVDPEEAFVAAIASCHMLGFLFAAAKGGYVVDRYVDAAVGEMGENAEGRAAVVRATLRPEVVFSGERVPDQAAVDALHHQAHEDCFIASSVRTAIEVAGRWRHAGAPAAAR